MRKTPNTKLGALKWKAEQPLLLITGPLDGVTQVDFEAAGQSILTETLREVRRLRPKALWGVSPYPTCYTLEPSQTLTPANSTGGCPAQEMELNNQLQWLWKRSSALYPFLSLEKLQVTGGFRFIIINAISIKMHRTKVNLSAKVTNSSWHFSTRPFNVILSSF